jgi:hypothetical protein
VKGHPNSDAALPTRYVKSAGIKVRQTGRPKVIWRAQNGQFCVTSRPAAFFALLAQIGGLRVLTHKDG